MKEKKAKWWKMFTHQRPGVEAVPDADVGQALKMAFRYYDGESVEQSDMSALAWTVFLPMKQYIDEAVSDYNASVELGRIGASKRWNRDSIGGLYDTMGVSTEAEAETDAEVEAEADTETEVKSKINKNTTTTLVETIVTSDYKEKNHLGLGEEGESEGESREEAFERMRRERIAMLEGYK